MINIYKSTRVKLIKINAPMWFNKQWRSKGCTPGYINITVNGNSQHSKSTKGTIHQINQEIKFLCRKRKQLNLQLYNSQLECSSYWNGMWQHIKTNTDEQIHLLMDSTYYNLNKELDILTKQRYGQHIKSQSIQQHHQHRLINLTNIQFTHEQLNTLNFGFSHALEKQPTNFINTLIIETENAIRQLDPSLQSVYRQPLRK
jgi:hypothetical protein